MPRAVKIEPRATVRIDAYRVIRDAVEVGVAYGWRRAHKHTDEPTDDDAIQTITEAVMGDLCEVIKFDD